MKHIGTASHGIVLHCTALHCFALHYTALHCIAMYCTVLHCNALKRLNQTTVYFTIQNTAVIQGPEVNAVNCNKLCILHHNTASCIEKDCMRGWIPHGLLEHKLFMPAKTYATSAFYSTICPT